VTHVSDQRKKESDAFALRCLFDWEDNALPLGEKNFPTTVVSRLHAVVPSLLHGRLLDVGCGVGRSSFEFARSCDEVVAIERSAYAVLGAQRLKESGMLRYQLPWEEKVRNISLNTFGLNFASKKVNFWKADLSTLRESFGNFDLISLFDPDIRVLQSRLKERLKQKGAVVVTSAYTPQSALSPERLGSIFSETFRCIYRGEIEMTQQTASRNYNYARMEMTIWEKEA